MADRSTPMNGKVIFSEMARINDTLGVDPTRFLPHQQRILVSLLPRNQWVSLDALCERTGLTSQSFRIKVSTLRSVLPAPWQIVNSHRHGYALVRIEGSS